MFCVFSMSRDTKLAEKELYVEQTRKNSLNFVADSPESRTRAIVHNVCVKQLAVWRMLNEYLFHHFLSNVNIELLRLSSATKQG